MRDLSIGGIIRQHRETDYYGNFVKKDNRRGRSGSSGLIRSAFDDVEQQELAR